MCLIILVLGMHDEATPALPLARLCVSSSSPHQHELTALVRPLLLIYHLVPEITLNSFELAIRLKLYESILPLF